MPWLPRVQTYRILVRVVLSALCNPPEPLNAACPSVDKWERKKSGKTVYTIFKINIK